MTDTHNSRDTHNLAIGILSITACILFIGFLLVTTLTSPARAIGMNDRGGDYLMLTQQLTSSAEGIVVIDAASQRMIVYSYDYSRKQLLPLSGFKFERLQKPTLSEDQEPAGGLRKP